MKECVTHHAACECREAKFVELEAENERLREALVRYGVHDRGHKCALNSINGLCCTCGFEAALRGDTTQEVTK